MKRRELCRTERSLGRHEIFSEEIGVLYHCAFERLENDAAFLQLFRNNIALDQLIAGKNHPAGEFIQSARVMQNVAAVVVRKFGAEFERCEIEKIDIREAPGLIFAHRPWDRFKFFPRDSLLLPKP